MRIGPKDEVALALRFEESPVDRPFYMDIFEAIILGLVQGLTEFFPISSSAHLRLTKSLLGINDGEHLLYFDLLLHAATLLSLLIFMRKEVWDILRDPQKMAPYFLALIPLIPAYFFLKPLRTLASDPAYLGYALMTTSFLLFAASRKKNTAPQALKWQHVLCIGIMQTMALIPGISRSGSTISAARFCGWSWSDAARFSFLLAIPTILGGEFLETMKTHETSGVSASCYTAGFIASFSVGLIAVRFVFKIYEKEYVRPFAWYCLAAGIFAGIALNG